MIVDARHLTQDSTLQCDVCIIGAGAAGITIARELIDQPLSVFVLETGGLKPERIAQSFMEGESAGHPVWPLDESRVAAFGGTTGVWAGACRPLDASDFQTRPWVAHSGWPFDRAKLEPYYARAQALLQLGPFAYALDDWESSDCSGLPLDGDLVDTHVFQLSPP